MSRQRRLVYEVRLPTISLGRHGLLLNLAWVKRDVCPEHTGASVASMDCTIGTVSIWTACDLGTSLTVLELGVGGVTQLR